jgi:hypothetical protein
MKLKTLLFVTRGPFLIGGAVMLATLVPQAKAHITLDRSYPSVVCPAALGGATESISLPTKGLSVGTVSGKSITPRGQKKVILKGSSFPTFISGNPGAEIAFESISGSSTADAVCDVGGADQWFIGGSGIVTSQGLLQIINSGLSESTIQIIPYGASGALAPSTVTVKANSSINLKLATIAPGEESIALHVITESGRVTSYLLDHRVNGLKDLGASFVNAVSSPTTTSYLAGLFGSAKKSATTLRFLVPGNIDANVHLSMYSNGGKFTPLGFDSYPVPHQKVVDVPLPQISLSTPFGIEITSDQPIFASALTHTSTGGQDFAWANQLTPLSNFKINLAGSAAQFLFEGSQPAIRANWIDLHGSAQSIVINGDTSAVWHPVGGLNGITFTILTKNPVYGGALVSNVGGGLNYLPLLPNQLVSRARAPEEDLRALARH